MKTPSIYSIFLLLVAALFFACKPDQTDIGSDLIPGEDQLDLYTYEAPVQAKTVREDSLPVFTGSIIPTTFLLGSYIDPIFGRVQANFASEFAPSKASFTFGDSAVIDSVILTCEYKADPAYYGDITKLRGAQHFKVYQLDEDVVSDTATTYYSNHNVKYKTLLGEKTLIPNNTGNVTWKKDTVTAIENPQLRIRLNDEAKLIFQNATAAQLATQADFYGYFRGLYVVADNFGFQNTGEGSILRFDAATSNKCRIRVFYHNSASTAENPFDFFDFSSTTATRKLNIFYHNYKNTQLQQDILYGGYNANRTYVQSMGGVKTKIDLPDFPSLPEFSDTTVHYVINKAELIIPVDESAYSYYYPVPNNIVVLSPNTGDQYDNVANPPNANIRDLTDVSQYFYGGAYNKDTKEYTFRISLHVSDLINRIIKKNRGLYIVNDLAGVKSDRVVFLNTPEKKIRLRIIYTKI